MDNKDFIVTAFTENQVGVLNRITAIYLRRKINIESLRVAETAVKGVSMFVINARTTQETIDKVVKHILRIVEVIDAKVYTADELITQEIALYKINKAACTHEPSGAVALVNPSARVVEEIEDYIVVELTGSKTEIMNFKELFEKRGILQEFTSSGSVVLHRDLVDLNEYSK